MKLKLLAAVAGSVLVGPLLVVVSNATAGAATPTPASPAPSPTHLTDAQKGAPGVPEVEEAPAKRHTLKEVEDEVNPTHSKGIVVKELPDGNFKVTTYRLADGDVPVLPAPAGGYQSLDLGK